MYTLLHVSIDVFFDMYVEMLDFFDVLIINLLYICETNDDRDCLSYNAGP